MESDTGRLLHAAVCAEPADNGRRLRYADWLTANDRPNVAGLIRLACALDALPPTVVAGHRCPACGGPGRWRSGVGFEHEKRCASRHHPSSVVWEPGKTYTNPASAPLEAQVARALRDDGWPWLTDLAAALYPEGSVVWELYEPAPRVWLIPGRPLERPGLRDPGHAIRGWFAAYYGRVAGVEFTFRAGFPDTVRLSWNTWGGTPCRRCLGTGTSIGRLRDGRRHVCQSCGGRRHQHSLADLIAWRPGWTTTCAVCGGAGAFLPGPCAHCDGRGHVERPPPAHATPLRAVVLTTVPDVELGPGEFGGVWDLSRRRLPGYGYHDMSGADYITLSHTERVLQLFAREWPGLDVSVAEEVAHV